MKWNLFTIPAVLLTLAAAAPETYHTGIKEILPAFENSRQENEFTTLLLDRSGKILGRLNLEDTGRYPRKTGYGGEIEVGVITDPSGKIIGVVTGTHNETSSYMKRLGNLKFFQRWNRLTLKEAAEKKVDAVTRATYSSEAIIHGVQSAAKTALSENNQQTNHK